MPDKLTDKEIFATEIKCINRRANGQCNGGTDCCKCDLLMNEKDIISAYEIAIANIDLINRLQAENKRLSVLAELGNTRANDYRVMRDRALKAEKEVERLKANEEMADGYADALVEYTKAEAYKEFAEEIFELFPKDKTNTVISRITVKHILKELVGEEP